MEPLISLQLLDDRTVYHPGETLRGEYQIDAVQPERIQAVEASVLWYTEGKGDEDIGVHFFERHTRGDAAEGDLRTLRGFEVPLPNSPLSYLGRIVKIRWCARVRLFLRGGKECTWQTHFRLLAPGSDSPDDDESTTPPSAPEEESDE